MRKVLLAVLLVAPLVLSSFVSLPGFVFIPEVQPYGEKPEWAFWAKTLYRAGGQGFGVYPAQVFTEAFAIVLGFVLLVQITAALVLPRGALARPALGRFALAAGTVALVFLLSFRSVDSLRSGGWTHAAPRPDAVVAVSLLAAGIATLAFSLSQKGAPGLLALVMGEQIAELFHQVLMLVTEHELREYTSSYAAMDIFLFFVPALVLLRRAKGRAEKVGLGALPDIRELALVPWALATFETWAFAWQLWRLPGPLLSPSGRVLLARQLWTWPLFPLRAVLIGINLALLLWLLRRAPEED